MHLPLAIGTAGSRFGDPIFGIVLASQILFGEAPEALPIEKQAILAAAIKRPIVLAPPGDEKAVAAATRRWEQAKDRADDRLRETLADSDEVRAARQRLAAMDLPQPAIDASLAATLPADPAAAWQVAVNSVRRVSRISPVPMLRSLRPSSMQASGQDWRGRIVAIHLTTSASATHKFVQSVEVALQHIQAGTAGVALPLSNDGQTAQSAGVVIAVVDPRSQISRIYASSPNLFWSWKTPLASTAKMVAAVALGRRDTPETLYCRAPLSGVEPASATTGCDQKSAWISARQAFARSDSRAIAWALHRLPHHELAEIAAAFNLPAPGETPLATALAYGQFELTPAETLRLVAAIFGDGMSGRYDDEDFPTIISSITVLDSGRTDLRHNHNSQACGDFRQRTSALLHGVRSPVRRRRVACAAGSHRHPQEGFIR